MELVVILGLSIALAILGPWLGVDSRVPGGWTPTDPDNKIWPDKAATPDPPGRRG